jgi:hypothetical protein
MASVGKLILAVQAVWLLYLWAIMSASTCHGDICQSAGIHGYVWGVGELILFPLSLVSLLVLFAVWLTERQHRL